MTSAPKLTAKIEVFNLSVDENERSAPPGRLPIPFSNRNFKISFVTVTPLMPAKSLKLSKVRVPSQIALRHDTRRVAFGYI